MHYRGKLGACPAWWPVLQAARRLGVPPWTISGEARPCIRFWTDRALAADVAAAAAETWTEG